ncbi:hypothetical protein [Segniliparus rugosus]|uniref:Uncharacterized protein n=1 Tax=Segniliparus rugosus (strain ATCC BAA-974 / DSM 45345 / CCUG 50838 / CIP 108380 / JCM 13579 / CDC 945) TaxID=679197 RepID=E5XS22_SEGRC|nr:hypothetical protein [Segniliparus rugosus]EFV12807.1 hypothetical protein HMPREF9336_02294 [Segniliparus rugosus ATCC BAA-974]
MAVRTAADTEKINLAEAKIAGALQSVRMAVDQLNARAREFHAAAGSDDKNGNLKQQSQADQDNKSKQYADTNSVAEKDQEAARAAVAQYSEAEIGNSVSLHLDNGLGRIVGFE